MGVRLPLGVQLLHDNDIMKVDIKAPLIKRIKEILRKEDQKISQKTVVNAVNIILKVYLVDHDFDLKKNHDLSHD